MGNAQSENSSKQHQANCNVDVAVVVPQSKRPQQQQQDNNDDNDVSKKKERNPFFLQKILRDIFQPQPSEPEPTTIRPPKHMLWGCETPEQHYDMIANVCAKAATLRGEEGLRELGFEYRMVHHPETCDCDTNDDCLAFDDNDDVGGDDDYGFMDDGLDQERQQEEFLAPIGVPLDGNRGGGLERTMTDLVESTIDRLSHQQSMDDSSGERPSSTFLSKKASNVSLFSLATHYTASTSASTTFPPGAISYNGGGSEESKTCDLRLHHIPSGGTLVTPENHQQFIAHGKMCDEIARLCMEKAQDVMMEEGQLQWVSVCDARGIEALVSKSLYTSKKVLLVVTGKGQVRAGIFSRRHLITTGMETSTALPLIREALRRNMAIVMLDPNAKGYTRGMEVVEASLEKIFFDRNDDEEEIYVVAHSMAGAQLVRFLHKHESSSIPAVGESQQRTVREGDAKDDKAACCSSSDDEAQQSFLRKIKAVAFTDSNHNINWTRNTPSVTNLLVGPSCIYIKSHKIHDDPKRLGEPHHHCDFWNHRFGAIKTLWAGTHEHALTNYTARYHIWDHFDEFLHPERGESDGGSDEEFLTYYGAEGLID